MINKDYERKLEDFFVFIHKAFYEDYDRQMRANYTHEKEVKSPLDGKNSEERLAIIYDRIKLNSQRLQELLDELTDKLKNDKNDTDKQ